MPEHPDPAAVAALLALADDLVKLGYAHDAEFYRNEPVISRVAAELPALCASWLQMRAALEDIRAVLRAPNAISPAIADMLAQTAEAALAGRAGE